LVLIPASQPTARSIFGKADLLLYSIGGRYAEAGASAHVDLPSPEYGKLIVTII